MGKFAGFVAKGDDFVFTVVTGSVLHVAEEPDAEPTYDLYEVTSGALTSLTAGTAMTQVGSVDGFYHKSIATTSLTVGARYYIKVDYEIDSTAYTEDLVFQVV